MGDLGRAVTEVNYIEEAIFNHIDDYYDSFACIDCVKTELLWGKDEEEDLPYISLVIPTYNRENTFFEAILSVINQKNPGCYWEVVVVDNTMFDDCNSTPVLRFIEKLNDGRVKYYHNEINIGAGYNWNRGVQLARGTWICFLHDDDILYPDALLHINEQITRFTLNAKPLGYIQARMDVRRDEKKKGDRKIIPVELTRFGTLIKYYTETGSPSCGTTILKKAYMQTGGIRNGYGPTADAILGYQIMRNYTVLTSDYVLGYRRNEDNESSNFDTRRNLILSDYYFARYVRNQSRFGKIFSYFLGNAQSAENARNKLKTHNIGMYSKKQDESLMKCSKVSILIFLAVRKAYSLLRLVKGWLLFR